MTDEINVDGDEMNIAIQALGSQPINPFNQTIQPLPTQVKQGLIESNQGPAGALTFMHPAGEYTFLTQDPQELDQLIAQIGELKAELTTASLRYSLTNPSSGLVIPTPSVPGANGAKLL